MRTLYPPGNIRFRSWASEKLAVGDGHQLHIEQCGNPNGIPALFLHGGPGGGCQPYHRQFFDPQRYRIILFDQRGCGQSLPHASLHNNTTAHLIADIERLREHLDIDQWLIFGGSWGSTLALAYAQQFTKHVSALVLRGIFLCRPQDIHWFYQHGASQLFPDYWQEYLAVIPHDEHDDLLAAYHRRLTHSDKAVQLAAARAWSVWEGRCSTLLPHPNTAEHYAEPAVALAMARVECDYFVNNAYLQPDQLIQNAAKLADIPAVLVHGRYDAVCPIDQAFALHEAWPQAEFKVIPDAGHSASEPGIIDALVTATDHFSQRLA